MSRLIVCSLVDLPSVNIAEALKAVKEWHDIGDALTESGDDVLLTIPDMHIRHDCLDAEAEALGVSVDSVVVLSRHSAKSGRPALTAHPIGNYHEADFGGRAETLVPASPAEMSEAVRQIHRLNTDKEVQTCFEVTHHGPLLSKPTFYIEIGSDERYWGNLDAARILARVLTEMEPHSEYRTLVGVGGGHYAPRFTELAMGYEVNFGHMVPNYQIEGGDDGDVARMIDAACKATGTDSVYIHRKSMKGLEARRIRELVVSAGYEVTESKDLDPIGGNRRTFL